jgi:hypothetical protein
MSYPQYETLIEALQSDGGEFAMLLAQPPIAFQRPFVSLTGSVTGALLLSLFVDLLSDPTKTSLGGWVDITAEEITERVGLSRKEQSTARAQLQALQLIEERKVGFPARQQVRLLTDRLETALLQMVAKSQANRPALTPMALSAAH